MYVESLIGEDRRHRKIAIRLLKNRVLKKMREKRHGKSRDQIVKKNQRFEENERKRHVKSRDPIGKNRVLQKMREKGRGKSRDPIVKKEF